MDFSKECLDKSTEFGVLWYYGNKDSGKINAKDIEKLNVGLLFQFIQIHKDAIDYQHWTILFKGFFVIMLNRFDLINKKFKLLHNDLKRKTKPSISDFQLLLNKKIDIDSELLSIEPPPIKKQPTKRITAQKKKETLIKEQPALYDLDELDISINQIDDQLQDDGFGGNLTNIVSVNVDTYFNLDDKRIDAQNLDKLRTSPPRLEYADELPDLNLSPISKVSKSIISGSPLDDTLITSQQLDSQPIQELEEQTTTDLQQISSIQENLKESREGLLSEDRRSNLASFRSGLVSISERLEDRLSSLQDQLPNIDDLSTELSFELSTLESAEKQQRKRGRKRKHGNQLVIDDVIEFKSSNYFSNNLKYHEKLAQNNIFNLAMPYIKTKDIFKRPLVPHSIEPLLDYYTTEQCDTDQLVIKEIPLLEDGEFQQQDIEDEQEIQRAVKRRVTFDDDDLSQLRITTSPQYSDLDYDYDQGDLTLTEDNQIKKVVRDVLNDIIDQVTFQLDEQPKELKGKSPLTSEYSKTFQYSDRIEMGRDASSGLFFSTFEPLMVQSDYDITNTFDRRYRSDRHDPNSLISYGDIRRQQDDDLRSLQSQAQQSYLSEISFSYADTILNLLDENNGQITFSELTNNFRKREVAKCFSDLLTMKMRREIEMIQADTTYFTEIYIKKI